MTAHEARNGDGGQVSASMLPITAPMRRHNIGISLEVRLCLSILGMSRRAVLDDFRGAPGDLSQRRGQLDVAAIRVLRLVVSELR